MDEAARIAPDGGRPDMEFLVLGGVELRSGEAVRPLSALPRRLLAVLLAAPGEVVPSARLIDELWDGNPPPSVTTTLRAHVSRLRAVLDPPGSPGASRLESRRDGYALRVLPGELDADEFAEAATEGRRLLDSGEPQKAEATLARALALWRGPAFDGCQDLPSVRSRVVILEQRRLVAAEDRLEAGLVLGRADLVAAEAAALLVHEPLRERLCELQMLALYRAGRQAEALRSYQQARRRLLDELGLEPGPSLRALEQAILAHDPALDAGPRARQDSAIAVHGPERQSPDPAEPPLLARTNELARLRTALAAAREGQPRLALILGEAGAGKTRLAVELSRWAAEQGVRTVSSRCHDGSGAPAFWPWIQVLRSILAAPHSPVVPSTALAELVGPTVSPSAVGASVMAGIDAPDAAEARFRVFDGVRAVLEAAAEQHPLLVFLDDLHWADRPSLELLRFLAGQLHRAPLLIVGAYRDDEVGIRPGLEEALAQLAREPSVTKVVVGGLSRADVARLLEHSMGRPASQELTGAVVERTEGNPFFVTEVGRQLAGADADAEAATVAAVVPGGVRALVAQRLAAVDEEVKRLLIAAAVSGREVDPSLVAGMADEPLLDVLEQLEAAHAAGFLHKVGPAFRFTHDILREAVLEAAGIAQRAVLHQRAGLALELRVAGDPGELVDRLAHHFHQAVAAGEVERAVRYARIAGDRAIRMRAHEAAAARYREALDVLERHGGGDPAPMADVALQLAAALALGGDDDGARRAFLRSAAYGDQAGDPRRVALSALGLGAGGVVAGEVDDELVALLERVVSALPGDDPLDVRVRARLGMELYYSSEADRGRSLCEEAVEAARRLGDPEVLGEALADLHFHLRGPDDLGRRVGVVDELFDVAEGAALDGLVFRAHVARFGDLLELGDVAGLRRTLAAYEELAAPRPHPRHDFQLKSWRALLALLEGALSEAEALATEAFEAGHRAVPGAALQAFAVQLATARRDQDRAGEMLDAVRDYVARFPNLLAWRSAFILFLVESGHEAEARQQLARVPPAGSVRRDVNWLPAMAALSAVAEAFGERDLGADLSVLLAPFAERFVGVGGAAPRACWGSVHHYLGLARLATGELPGAEAALRAAVAANEAAHAPGWAGHSRVDLARVLRRRGGVERQREAAQLLADARAAGAALELPYLVRRAQSESGSAC